ncbi:CBS domain-containing protein [Natrinema sp. DC36]|uniref:CBS domain-containing protein n=1 Tax=Natrinema sp. DC36 TaxID=2878680 RepID=UPI001CF02B93|nr:CBS domain-containing protein [Natrinema sp. DC36]
MIPFYIGEVMRKRSEELEKERKAARAIEKLEDPEVDLVVVTDRGDPVGVFTDAEVVTLIAEKRDVAETTLAECQLSPVVTIDESEEVETAAILMNKHGLRYLLVTKASQIVGYLMDKDVRGAVTKDPK